jgi:uncharacterized lipoprotein
MTCKSAPSFLLALAAAAGLAACSTQQPTPGPDAGYVHECGTKGRPTRTPTGALTLGAEGQRRIDEQEKVDWWCSTCRS